MEVLGDIEKIVMQDGIKGYNDCSETIFFSLQLVQTLYKDIPSYLLPLQLPPAVIFF